MNPLLLLPLGLYAPAPPVPPRWLDTVVVSGQRPTPEQKKKLRDFVVYIRGLSILTPPPGVYPKASFSAEPPVPRKPQTAVFMLGFWPPKDVGMRNGKLVSLGELLHLIFYVNQIREEALYQDRWHDGTSALFPLPERLGEVQGFPVYRGFGGSEVSGILVIQQPGRTLFSPVTQERFRRFAITRLEKELMAARPSLVRAQEAYAIATSPAGRAQRDAQLARSLEDYKNKRPRTPEQMEYREKELRRMDTEEVERLRIERTPEGNRVTGRLLTVLTREKAAFSALSPAERGAPAWHLPDSRETGPHPVPAGTSGAVAIVALAKWDNTARPRSDWQLLTVERYWTSVQTARNSPKRTDRNIYYHLNKEVIEAIDWKLVTRRFFAP